jgi:hypothetical protein
VESGHWFSRPRDRKLTTIYDANRTPAGRPSRNFEGSGSSERKAWQVLVILTENYAPDLSGSFEVTYRDVRRSKPMLKSLILGGAAIATLVTPAVADAQYYGYNNGYSYQRHHHRSNAGAAIAGALVGGVLGYALGSSHGYGYSYPSYGYSNYGYQPSYNYSYPSYGYNYGYASPSYGYNGGYGYRHDDDGDD